MRLLLVLYKWSLVWYDIEKGGNKMILFVTMMAAVVVVCGLWEVFGDFIIERMVEK